MVHHSVASVVRHGTPAERMYRYKFIVEDSCPQRVLQVFATDPSRSELQGFVDGWDERFLAKFPPFHGDVVISIES